MKKNQKKDEEEEEKKRRARLRGEIKQEDEEEEEDWDPEPILKVCYTNEEKGEFIVATTGQFKGFFYSCSFSNLRPLKAHPQPENYIVTQFLQTAQNDMIIMAFENGEIRLVNISSPDRYLVVK